MLALERQQESAVEPRGVSLFFKRTAPRSEDIAKEPAEGPEAESATHGDGAGDTPSAGAAAEDLTFRLSSLLAEAVARYTNLGRQQADEILAVAQDRASAEVAHARHWADGIIAEAAGVADGLLREAQERSSAILAQAERRAQEIQHAAERAGELAQRQRLRAAEQEAAAQLANARAEAAEIICQARAEAEAEAARMRAEAASIHEEAQQHAQAFESAIGRLQAASLIVQRALSGPATAVES